LFLCTTLRIFKENIKKNLGGNACQNRYYPLLYFFFFFPFSLKGFVKRKGFGYDAMRKGTSLHRFFFDNGMAMTTASLPLAASQSAFRRSAAFQEQSALTTTNATALSCQLAAYATSIPMYQHHRSGQQQGSRNNNNNNNVSNHQRSHSNNGQQRRYPQNNNNRSHTQQHQHRHHNHGTSSSSTSYQDNLSRQVQATSEGPVTPLTLEEKLQRRFGPHAKLVVRQHQQQPQRAPGSDAAAEPSDSTKALSRFKASVTFKQLGFPVEIASIEADTFDKAEALVFETAMNSNVIALLPTMFRNHNNPGASEEGDAMLELRALKRTVDDLRNACQTLGRILKFSVKPKVHKPKPQPASSSSTREGEATAAGATANDGTTTVPPVAVSPPPMTAAAAPPVFGCRVYFRDDWSVTANLSFLHEARGYSPNDALSNCFREVGKRFADELASDAFVKADFLEAVRVLDLHGKSVVANVMGAPLVDAEKDQGQSADLKANSQPQSAAAGGTTSISIVARVTDHSTSNSYEVRCAEQESLVDAYRTIAQHIFNAEANTSPPLSLVDDTCTAPGSSPTTTKSVSSDHNAVAAEWLATRPVFAASRTVGGNVFTLADQADAMPLKLKLRYQCEGMLYHALESQLIREAATPPGSGNSESSSSSLTLAETARRMMRVKVEEIAPTGGLTLVATADSPSAAASERIVSTRLYQFRATATLNGVQVGQSEGHGAYRVELDVWIQLLNHLLDLFPEIARYHFAHCYPTVEALERAAHHHDNYRMFNLKGKWTVYGVLGAIASTLLTPSSSAMTGGGGGHRFDKILTDFDGTNTSCRAEAKIIVNDGYHSKAVIAKRFGPQRGHALRMAVTDAIQQNFPNQYQIAIQHDDFGASLGDGDDVSAHGRRLRALPREKRVSHVNQLFGVIGCFAEEDYGWRALRIRTRTVAGDAARCIAELEAQVQGERGRRIVAASPIAATAKNAKKLLIYQVCKQYFPNDLENYKKLGRGDARHPEALMADHNICRVYSAAAPFFAQVLAMLDRRQPDLAPFSWRLERARRSGSHNHEDDDGSEESLLQPLFLQFKATVLGNNGDVVVAERLGDEGEGALSVVRSVLRATCVTYIKDAGSLDSVELWREFETSPPPPVSSSHDLCNVLFQLTLGGLGGGDGSSRDAVNAQQQLAAQGRPSVEVLCTQVNAGGWWLATVVLPNMVHTAIARAAGRTKREAHRGALMLATRTCFAKQLRYYSKNFVEVHAFTDEIFHERVALSPQVDRSLSSRSNNTTVSSDTTNSSPVAHSSVVPPKRFLETCLAEQRPPRQLMVRYEQQVGGSSWECRLYSVCKDDDDHSSVATNKPGEGASDDDVQIGFGTGLSKAHALHGACTVALEAHFAANVEARRVEEPKFLMDHFHATSFASTSMNTLADDGDDN
jgi:hypothetical protein